MDYKLRLKKKSTASFSTASLFPDLIIDIDLDFYNVDSIEKIKVPVSISVSLPMDSVNTSILGYNPESSPSSSIPDVPFDFELYSNNVKMLEGNMYVESYSFNNQIPTIDIRLVDSIQDIIAGSKLTTFADMYDDLDSDRTFSSFLSSNSETIGTNVSMEPVLFPYIDFCNDISKFNFASRQFLQHGFSTDKAGFVPALNVKSFVQRFFSEANTSVVSRFFKLGSYGSAVPDINPDDMYLLIPEKLLTSPSTTTGFILTEGPYEHFVNEYTADADSNITNAKESGTNHISTYGWNYNSTTSANAADTGFGLERKSNLANNGTNVDRAYHGPHMSYTARPSSTPRSMSGRIGYELSMIKTGNGEFSMVWNIFESTSTAVFQLNAVLWKDGSPYERFKLSNTDGTAKQFNVSESTIDTMRTSTVGYFGVLNGTAGAINQTSTSNGFNNVMYFNNDDIGDFIWEQKEVEIDAGSTYAVTMEWEWVSGQIDLRYVDSWSSYQSGLVPNAYVNRTVNSSEVIKAAYYESSTATGNMYLGLYSVGFKNPYYDTDIVNVYDIFRESNLSPFDILKSIISRFNLSVVYDQKTSSVLLDRLPDLRSRNTNENITSSVDDANEISIDISTKRLKSLEITTSSKSLFYDNYGYKKKDISLSGSDDVKFSLDSRVYNKSLCGDDTSFDVPEGFSEYEIGFVSNEFTSYKDIGVVFGYIDSAQYTTNIKRARFEDKTNYKGLVYSTEFTHTFPRFVTNKSTHLPLYHFNEQGVETDLYDFFVGNDNVLYLGKNKITFEALFESDYVFDVKDNYSMITIGQVSSSGMIIKSISGQLYEGGIYGQVEAIIL